MARLSARAHTEKGNLTALGNRYATAALLAALALVLVALAGCGVVASASSTGAATNTVTASGAGTTQAAPDTARSVPIEPGQLDITANVVVVSELEQLLQDRSGAA